MNTNKTASTINVWQSSAVSSTRSARELNLQVVRGTPLFSHGFHVFPCFQKRYYNTPTATTVKYSIVSFLIRLINNLFQKRCTTSTVLRGLFKELLKLNRFLNKNDVLFDFTCFFVEPKPFFFEFCDFHFQVVDFRHDA